MKRARAMPAINFTRKFKLKALALSSLVFLAACQDQQQPLAITDTVVPETQKTVAYSKTAIRSEKYMIATAHPLASQAGLDMLRLGGSALDAMIASELVLSLVEPQSSGIGGGAFLVSYNAKTGSIDTYDGRETAPQSAKPGQFLDASGKPKKFYDAAVGGTSVGVPGLLAMLELAHKENGKLPWAVLFQPAIELAENGFNISQRLAKKIANDKYLKTQKQARDYFYDENGAPLKAGTLLKNPELATVLTQVANFGAGVFYKGKIAREIARTINTAIQNKGDMKVADISAYKAIKRPPVCLPYKANLLCGMGPPSSGGLTTLQILGMLQSFNMETKKPGSVEAVHLIAEASRLAFADRNTYMADPDFVPVPEGGLLNQTYLKIRAQSIDPNRASGARQPGMPGAGVWLWPASDDIEKGLSTTHISVIDGDGNAASMTASIENAFGSRLMSQGFLLNNQLTDFSFSPEKDGAPVANAVEGGKRPRSSMSPMLVFDGSGKVILSVGTPGGSRIIGYVAKTLIGVLDWGLDIQQAINLPNFVNRNGTTELEKGTELETLRVPLENLGHEVKTFEWKSGLQGVQAVSGGFVGGADPRREGVVLGD